MTSKLEIYQGALRLLGPHQLASLTETIPARLRLDEAWDSVVRYCLKRGLWNFAIRSIEWAHDEDVEPLFGYDYAFLRPDDFLRIASISNTATFTPFEDFENEADRFYANQDPLYLRYVSDDPAYGLNLADWPEDFCDVVKARLAFEVSLSIAGDRGLRSDALGLFDKSLSLAKSLDAIDERVKVEPAGRFVRARVRYGSRYRG